MLRCATRLLLARIYNLERCLVSTTAAVLLSVREPGVLLRRELQLPLEKICAPHAGVFGLTILNMYFI